MPDALPPIPIDVEPERIGPYRVIGELDRGGMGRVYRAHDSRLQRDVAVKVLLGSGASDADRFARFITEARAASALNHPAIVTVFDGAPEGNPPYIVTELIDGCTLRHLLDAGRLPPQRVVSLASQIADGLAAAHGAHLIHRDLKPENVMVTRDGRVKILDFGLARFDLLPRSSQDTLTAPHTIVGTAPYMSPEQARGASLDFRSDLFSFGSIVYEMASGRRAFNGSTTIETLAAILETNPPPLDEIDERTPLSLRRIVERCLEKQPEDRYGATSDLLHDLRLLDGLTRSERWRGWRGRRIPALAVIALIAAVGGAFVIRAVSPADRPSRLARVLVGVTPAETLVPASSRTDLALSPDGRLLVFGAVSGGQQRLYVRAIDRLEAVPIPGTENSNSPFFSPDGQWLGFWTGELRNGGVGALKRVAIAGGDPIAIANVAPLFGASWGPNQEIFFADRGGLLRVRADGGRPERITPSGGNESIRQSPGALPHVLPDGRGVLYTIRRTPPGGGEALTQTALLSLPTGGVKLVLDDGADARYVPTGHLVFIRAGTVMVVPFDIERLAVAGQPRPMINDVAQSVGGTVLSLSLTFAGQFAVSTEGTLAYIPQVAAASAANARSVILADTKGTVTTLPIPRRRYLGPRFSPDGREVALTVPEATPSLFIHDLADGSTTPLRPEMRGAWASWQPDGRAVTVANGVSLTSYPRDGGAETQLARVDGIAPTGGWSPDGQTLAYVRLLPSTNWQIWLWSRATGPRLFRQPLPRPVMERFPTFSPDGQWIAYGSDESGRDEVYIQRFPQGTDRRQVTPDGGLAPRWSPRGEQLFFMKPEGGGHVLFAVDVHTTPAVSVGAPRRLLSGPYAAGTPMANYDVSPDGRRFVLLEAPPAQAAVPGKELVVVFNWLDELK